MKKFLFLLAMLFIIAGLMAGVVKAVPKDNSQNAQVRYPTREVFYTEDFESGAEFWTHYDGAVSPSDWHIYDNGDAQGNVWWMGDPAMASGTGIGGYHDHQYLVLDTPASPITAGNTTLTFQMRMNMEAAGGTDFDGWDSFNIRISDNAGLSWTVLPAAVITPTYDFANSYAFGSEHGETPPIPAWGGVHEPWVLVTVDLSAYVGSSVKIRFAFASDPAYNTEDDETMYGVMVDDIAFGSYTNNGVDDSQMTWASLVPTAGDFWHIADVGNDAPSPTHIMSSLNGAGTYVPFMLNYLESPEILLPAAASQIVADFQLKGTFADAGVFPDVDLMGWEIYHSGSWHYMSNPYGYTIPDPNTGPYYNYVFSSIPDTWASMVNSYTPWCDTPGVQNGDISLLAGQTVKFRWYFQSNDTVDGTPLQIDNFQIFSVSDMPESPNLVYPINGATGLPMTGFDLDWTASSLGALPDYYVVYMDQLEDNLINYIPTYTSPDQTVSYYDPVADELVTFTSNQTWYWRVGAFTIDPAGEALSDIFRFDIVDASLVVTEFPWNEGFEGATFPPDNWTTADIDAGGTYWEQNIDTDYVHTGVQSAVHGYSTAVPDPGQNGWMITPGIFVPATGMYYMSWWNYNDYPTWMAYNGLMVNTVSNPADPGWVEIWSQDAASDSWTNVALDISAYAGQIVYFAFIYQGYDADDWYVDDVSVFELTVDEMPPIISHLPVLNTLRDDITFPVSVDVVDDAIWNNLIGGVNLYYSTDGGTIWSAPIAMTLGTAPTYTGEIPAAFNVGDTVTYKFEAWDILDNLAVATYSFEINDPVWIYYDMVGPTAYNGNSTILWGPMVYFDNPLYGTNNALKLLSASGITATATDATLYVYGEDLEGNITNLITPTTVTFTAGQAWETFDLSAYNIQIDTPYFWIVFGDMTTCGYYGNDQTYDYTPSSYIMYNGTPFYSFTGLTGEWCIDVQVQTGDPALYFAPELTIANVSGNPEVSWDALTGAASYDVYGAADPYAAFPAGWTLLADNTTLTSYTYMGTEPKQFFKVVASTNVGGSKAMTLKSAANRRINAPEITVSPKSIRPTVLNRK